MSTNWKRFNFFDREAVGDQVCFLVSPCAVRVYSAPAAPPPRAAQPIEVSCSSSGRGLVALGDAQGYLHLIHDRSFEKESHQIYNRRVTHVHVLKRHAANVLVTVGDGKDPRPFEEQEESRLAASSVMEKLRREKAAAEGEAAAEAPPVAVGGAGAALEPSVPAAMVKVWRLEAKDGAPTPVCSRSFRAFDIKSADVPDDCAVTCVAVTEDLTQVAIGCGDGTVFLFRGEFHRDRGSVKREILMV